MRLPLHPELAGICCCLVLSTAVVARADLRAELKAGLEERAAMLNASRWTFTHEVFVGDPVPLLVQTTAAEVLVYGREARIRRHIEVSQPKRMEQWLLEAFNKEGTRTAHSKMMGEGEYNGVVTSDSFLPWRGEHWPQLVGINLTGTNYSPLEVLSGDSDDNVEVARDQTTGLIRLTINTKIPNIVNRVTCDFDPSAQWLMTRAVLEMGMVGQAELWQGSEYRVTERMLSSDGKVAVPRVVELTHLPSEAARKTPGLTRFSIKSVESNVPTTAGDFVMKFPVGMKVYDAVHDVSFIAGKAAVVAAPNGMHYHVAPENFPFLKDFTDFTAGMSDDEWNRSPTKKMVDQTWAEIVDGQVVPRSAGAAMASVAPALHPVGEQTRLRMILLASAAAAGAGLLIYGLYRPAKPR